MYVSCKQLCIFYPLFQVVFGIMGAIPLYVFYLILLLWYIYHIVDDIGIFKTRKWKFLTIIDKVSNS